jgi:CBS domain-containing protein
MPVEDAKGQLVGLVTSRLLLRGLSHNRNLKEDEQVTVEKRMIKNPKTVLPSTMLSDAIKTMRDNKIGCLPVVNEGGELVGIITEMDFLRISVRLIEK